MSILDDAFDLESFERHGKDLISELGKYLEEARVGIGDAYMATSPEEEYLFWKHYQLKDPIQFHKDLIQRSVKVHHRKYIGHQVSPPAPLAALGGFASDFLNHGMGIYEMGSAATAIEKIVIEKFCEKAGYDDEADGFLTSGGTLANLTALLSARAVFREKYSDHTPYVIVSDQAHYCIERATQTMGFRPDQLIKIPAASDYKINIDLLEECVITLHKEGKKAMSIVGCACSTSTGTYDNLVEIARICTQHEIWMHVDAAHGGGALFSKKHRNKCRGISNANSIVIDAHKMLLTPALATALLFQKSTDSYRSFATEAVYLFEKKEEEWFNLTKRTYETTKYMMSIKVYLLMQYYGEGLFEEYIDRQYGLAQSFENVLRNCEEFEIATPVSSNIVCFRFVGSSGDLNVVNESIRRQLINNGTYYIVQTTLGGKIFLRLTIMSPFTQLEDLRHLLTEIQSIADSLAIEK